MVIGKIKPTATIVAQFAAGVEIEAIQHEGKMYLPVVGMGEFATKEDAPAKPSVPASKPDKPAEETPASENEKSKVYTEDELMDMDVKSLTKILKDDFGIDPNDHDGKNTNKKLRSLILEAQENGESSSDAEEETEEPKNPAKKSPAKPEKEDAEDDGDGEKGNLFDQVADILEDFDAGKKTKKKAISAITSLVDDADEDKVTELVEQFEDDGDADLDEMAEKIANVLESKKPEKKSPSRRAPKKEKEDLVDVDDLEVGDRVSVWWNDDNQDWFDGEVKSIKKGKVIIAYDDETEEAIDPEVHTKIKRLAE